MCASDYYIFIPHDDKKDSGAKKTHAYPKEINLLIQVNNTIIYLKNDAASRLIPQKIGSRPTHLIIQKCLKYLRSLL